MGFLLCLTGLGFQPVQAQSGFQVSPARLYFHPEGNTVQTAKLHVNNPTDSRLTLQATFADWRRDSTGSKVYFAPGALPNSCSSMIKVTPSVIDLAPGEERDVLVTFTASKPLTPGQIRNSMLFLTQSNEQELARARSSAPQFVIKMQIGVHVYVLPEGSAQPDIAITGLDVVKSENQRQVKVQIENGGGTLLESHLRLEYLNLETMEEIKAEPIAVNTMPKDAFKVTADIPAKLTSGKYLIVAVLDSGPSQTLKVAELETVLK
ncbi:hypothetical protein ACFQ4C_17765 [Larkinella insperata]|uniref:Molecular chaperone n=1 Tax=Larkinella insperata TaxID=332158 RepID=A0ABW3QKC4_9BACT|nr:hypothetical protein [Larkinella insperata]